MRTEHVQIAQGKTIRVVSVFPSQGRATPEDKLKALIDLNFQWGERYEETLDVSRRLEYPVIATR